MSKPRVPGQCWQCDASIDPYETFCSTPCWEMFMRPLSGSIGRYVESLTEERSTSAPSADDGKGGFMRADTETLTISQLIDLLQARLATHGDIPVLVTWESTTNSLTPAHVYRAKSNEWLGGALLIDADENSYKHEYAADPTEGEPVTPDRGKAE